MQRGVDAGDRAYRNVQPGLDDRADRGHPDAQARPRPGATPNVGTVGRNRRPRGGRFSLARLTQALRRWPRWVFARSNGAEDQGRQVGHVRLELTQDLGPLRRIQNPTQGFTAVELGQSHAGPAPAKPPTWIVFTWGSKVIPNCRQGRARSK